MATLEFFYDLSSPWTRMAFHNVQSIVAASGAQVIWRPFLVGGVFNAVNSSVYASRANPDDPKLKASGPWLKEWAQLAGVPMNFPTEHHPLKSVLPMRVCCVLEHDQDTLFRFSSAAFNAYFTDGLNLDDPQVVAKVANSVDLDGPTLLTQAGAQPAKDRLRANTDEAIDRGAFGSPTLFVDRERMYFGNDQLPLVAQALG